MPCFFDKYTFILLRGVLYLERYEIILLYSHPPTFIAPYPANVILPAVITISPIPGMINTPATAGAILRLR